MNILKAYTTGFKSAGRTWKMTTLIYVIILILGIIITLPFLGELKRNAGNSMAIHNLLEGYDFTVFVEFFNEAAMNLGQFIRQGLWVAFLFIFISMLLTGGILHIFSDKSFPFTIERFFSGCTRYFFRFFKLSMYMLVPSILISTIIFLIIFLVSAGSYSNIGSEKSIFYIVFIGLCFWLLVMIYFVMIADYARFYLVKYDSSKVLRSLWESVKFVSRNIIFTYGLYLFLLVVPVVLIYIFSLLSNIIGMSSGLTIFVMFILQQIFIWSRVYTRVWTFASQMDYYYSKL